MNFKIFDSHTHIGHSKFDKDRKEAISRAIKASINFIEVGNDGTSSQKAVELAKEYPGEIWATVGCHPHYIEEFDYDFYKKLAQEPEVAAIGECGLDYYFRKNSKFLSDFAWAKSGQAGKILNKQKEIFIKHIELAKEVKKPLMIHCREAFSDLIKILKFNTQNLKPGVLHFFTGNLDDAKHLLEMGFYFTFNGLITFNRDFDELIKYIPLNRILLETDAPYVAPLSRRGKRNEPVYVIETAKKMAEIKGVSLEEICRQTTANTKEIFKLL